MERLLIVGAGGHAKVVADAAIASGRFRLVGFADDNASLYGHPLIAGYEVLGAPADISNWAHDAIVIAIGDNRARRRFFNLFSQRGEVFARVIHPNASISPYAAMGVGTVVFAGAVINADARIGVNVIVNTAASVDHDTWVEDHTHIAPGARLAGGCHVGAGVLIGIGAVMLPMRTIGAHTIVGAGAVVVGDLPDNVTAVGVPARVRD